MDSKKHEFLEKDDTLHLNQWKQKCKQLQKLVDERTANLELKNRELEIEAALEKIRSCSLGIQNSDQIREIVKVVFEKLKELKFATDGGAFVATIAQNSDSLNCWVGNENSEYPGCVTFPQYDAPTITDIWNAKKSGLDFTTKTYSFKEKNIWFEYAFNHTDLKTVLPEDFKKWVLEQECLTQSFALQKNSMIGVHFHHAKTLTENEIDILKKFSRIFEQSYIRFLDLQKAEAQAREAQIEAALERVRSRSLAMKQSHELQEVISVVFVQMQKLGIKADASLINILSDDSKDFYLWIGTVGQTYAQKIKIPYIKHPVFDVFYEARDRGETFMTNALTRAEKDSFFEYAFKHSDLKLMPDDRKKYVMDSAGFARSFAWSKNSGITIQNYAGIPYSDQQNDILKRFAHVFEQVYTRFLDVKNAEAQAREADYRAALDRVRGEIASMRTKEDLNRITPLIWKELNTLGVTFIRCGVLIMDESIKIIHTYLSKPNGESLSAFDLPFDSKEIGIGAVKHWKQNEIYYEHWDKNQFVSFMQNLIDTGQIEKPENYQGNYAPPESLYLHLVPFKQGMLYVGNVNPLKPEELQLVKALSETLSVAYSRYEDFRLLEEAKNQIEKTLSELRSAQSQLIQAEKMASLGELTAGIAHEIQNPLNFVNNFSEVSSELIEEMKEELAEGSKQYAAGSGQSGEEKLKLANEIADDIEQNLKKINHHGKRAADIVKGMLQHSRTGSGQKELTDINALADEYLRLSYHGLRAKDNSFKADFKTEFDPDLPKINVIPQEIGRVLLNLINNAFYAVTAPPPTEVGIKNDQLEYRPTVIVRTSYLPPSADGGMRGTVSITVSDNGPGIPDSIKDKIFQPFFTTKPTGSGTGLGLSLSYDIVKAHGGEIKVETKVGEGSVFILTLNCNNELI